MDPAARLGIVSHRRRLAAAAGRRPEDAAALLLDQVAAAAECGLAFFQLREPDLETRALLGLTRQLVAVAAGRIRIVVNDRADVAAAAGADLHLRESSFEAVSVRRWMATGTWISRAVHGAAGVGRAVGVDAVIAGTAATSPSKPDGTPTLGPNGLSAIVAASPVPVFAIGGLGPAAWPWVAASGAFGMAAIGHFLPRPGEDVGGAVYRGLADMRDAIGRDTRRYSIDP